MLHAELKRSVVDDIARTASMPLTSAPTAVISMLTPTQPAPGHLSPQKWQTELVVPLHFTLHHSTKQDAVRDGRPRPRCRHLRNWTKHTHHLILAYSVHFVKK